MQYAEARYYLNRVRNARLNVVKIEKRIAAVRFELEHPLGNATDPGDRIQTGTRSDALERKVIKLLEILDKNQQILMERKSKLESLIMEAFNTIMGLPECVMKEFLIGHYIDGISEIDYASIHGYETTESVRNLKWRAIKFFAQNTP